MKYMHMRTKQVNGSFKISFFFNARGEDLEKSTLGMYRSLLLQLLEAAPELISGLEPARHCSGAWKNGQQWNVESLKYAFCLVVKSFKQHHLICFIDALDECAEDEVRDLVEFFEELGQLADSTHVPASCLFL